MHKKNRKREWRWQHYPQTTEFYLVWPVARGSMTDAYTCTAIRSLDQSLRVVTHHDHSRKAPSAKCWMGQRQRRPPVLARAVNAENLEVRQTTGVRPCHQLSTRHYTRCWKYPVHGPTVGDPNCKTYSAVHRGSTWWPLCVRELTLKLPFTARMNVVNVPVLTIQYNTMWLV